MLPDLLAPELEILFCGTAAGKVSAARGHYYSGPGNKFWRLLAETGLTPRQLRPEEDHLLPSMGYGLTDLAKGVAGMDRDIPLAAYVPARLATLVAHHRPRIVAFTSLAAARLASGNKRLGPGPVPGTQGGGLQWALSSPSGANGHFDAASWLALAAQVSGDRR